ncbi:unnamed protein product [Ectocarpus sp. CCAP 1310/34]|nr:unnamed protein product [Ectocarpus sp. CCAP 1310/34]
MPAGCTRKHISGRGCLLPRAGGGSEDQGAWGTACTLHHQLAGPGNT